MKRCLLFMEESYEKKGPEVRLRGACMFYHSCPKLTSSTPDLARASFSRLLIFC